MAFNNSEKEATLEKQSLVAARESNEKLNAIYKKSSEVLEARAAQLEQMCKSLHSQFQESSDQVVSLRQELSTATARNQ